MRAAEVGFVTARGYRAAKTRAASARTLSDQMIGVEIARLHAENYGVYGVRKMHLLLGSQGWSTGRDQTGRIMRSLGLRGVKRGKRVFTTKSGPCGHPPGGSREAPLPRRLTTQTPGRRRHLFGSVGSYVQFGWRSASGVVIPVVATAHNQRYRRKPRRRSPGWKRVAAGWDRLTPLASR